MTDQAALPSTFQDLKNRSWVLRLTAPLLKDIEQMFGVKLTSFDKDPLSALATDPVMLVDVLYVICRDQADKVGITDREFGESLPEGLETPVMALRGAIINFFPPGKRSAIQRALLAAEEVSNKTLQKMVDHLDQSSVKDLMSQKAVELGMAELEKLVTES